MLKPLRDRARAAAKAHPFTNVATREDTNAALMTALAAAGRRIRASRREREIARADNMADRGGTVMS